MVPPVCPRSVAGRRAGEMPRGHRGGCGKKRVGSVAHHASIFRCPRYVFFVLDRTTRAAPAGRDWTGATPHF